MDPWSVELIVTATGRIDDAERRAVSRDVERGLLHRVRRGVQVDAAAWHDATGPAGERARHVLMMRALAESRTGRRSSRTGPRPCCTGCRRWGTA